MKKAIITVLTFTVFILFTSCTNNTPPAEEYIQPEEPSSISSTIQVPDASQNEPDISKDFFLRMKKSEDTYQIDGCIIDAFSIIYEENDFPDKEAVRLSKEAVYGYESWGGLVANYNEDSPDALEELSLGFICGAYEDFDGDGTKESVILMGTPVVRFFTIEHYYYIYVNDNNAVCFMGSLDVERFELLRFGDSVCVKAARTWDTGLGTGEGIFTFFSGEPNQTYVTLGGRNYTYLRSYFSCYDYYRFLPYWDSIAIWDSELKTIRELGIEEISKEEFADFFENGAEGLDYFEAATGQNDYKIYTQGYVYFFLYVSDECTYIFMTDENGQARIETSPQFFHSFYFLTDDQNIYGINANNLKLSYTIDLPNKTIERINELAQKSETFNAGLTVDEQAEFESLKREYIAATSDK